MEKEAANRLASIGGPVGRRYRPKRMFWKSLESFVTKAILVSMCVLNFESCALVRQRTKRGNLHQKQFEHHESTITNELCDSLSQNLQITFDGIEIICYDTASSVPSPIVKVRATKAAISKQTQQIVTQSERTAECDSIRAEIAKEIIEGKNNDPPQDGTFGKIPVIGIAVIILLILFILTRKGSDRPGKTLL